MKKIFMSIVIGLVVLVVAVVVGLGMFLGPVVKVGMEVVGPKVTQVPVKVAAVNVSLLTGSAQVSGLSVGNPKGFSSQDAIKLSNASVKLAPLSVFSDKIVVHSIRIESPEISFEGGPGSSNLSKIMENVNAAAKTGPGTSAKTGAPAKGEAGKKDVKKIQVDELLITGAKARVSTPGGTGQQTVLSLPDIHLKDLGKGSDGLTPEELVQAVMREITGSTFGAISNSLGSLGQGFQKMGSELQKEGSNPLNLINKGLDGLLGK